MIDDQTLDPPNILRLQSDLIHTVRVQKDSFKDSMAIPTNTKKGSPLESK